MLATRTIPVALCLLAGLGGCTKESLLRSTLADPSDRKEIMEITLKILDEHPEYVDDLLALARGHEPMFDRLMQQSAVTLEEDPTFAPQIASKLARHPKALEVVTRATLVEGRGDAAVRSAIAAATLAESDVVQTMASEHPELVQQIMTGMFSRAPLQ